MIETLIQNIHTCRDSSDLDDYYNQAIDGFSSGYYSMNMALKAIREINHRRYSDFGLTEPKDEFFTTYDEDSLEFFERASVTDAAAKIRVNNFIKGAKFLGIWDDSIFVTCHSDMGGVHQLGGDNLKSNTPWSLTGDATLTTDGILATGYVDASYSFPNSLQPTAAQRALITDTTLAANPVFVVGAWSQDYIDTVPAGRVYAVGGPFVHNFNVVGTYYGTSGYGDSVTGVDQWGVTQVTYSDPPQFRTRNRPVLLGAWLHNGPQFAVNLVNGVYDRRANAGVSRFPDNLKFASGTTSVTQGKIHFAMLSFCDPNTVGGKTSWQRLYALLNSTLWSHKRTNGHLRVQIGGQSNANFELAVRLNRDHLSENNTRCSEVYHSNTGGVAITQWVGTGTPARTATYQTSYWKGDGTGILELGRPLTNIGQWREYVVWFQGESDSETDDLTNNYKSRLKALIGFWKEDTGNDKLRPVIIKIGYHYSYRCQTGVGNFVISGLTGVNSVLNGTWVVQTLTTATQDYSWKLTGYTLSRNNSRWEFRKDSDNSLFAYSNDNPQHPELVSGWTYTTSGGEIAMTTSRLGRIEKIRKAQEEVSNEIRYCKLVDARNFEYNAADTPHLTTAGIISLASYLATILT